MTQAGMTFERRGLPNGTTAAEAPPSPSPLPPGAREKGVYDAANQLKEIRQGSATGSLLASLTYDANGNLTQKTEGATTISYTYDALNRLAQVTGTGQPPHAYVYDHDGRRIQKTVGTATSYYLYSGPDIVAEYCDTWTAASALTTHGPHMDDPLLRASGSTANYYHQDGLGSVVAVSNGTGGTEGTVRYDAWGSRIATTGFIPQYGYTGREPDGTGLIYYRGRYYDPALGRFTQRDPIGLAGGLNQYAYVGNNPTNFTDPMGLLPRLPTNDANYFNTIDTLPTVYVTATRLTPLVDPSSAFALGLPTLPSLTQGVVLPTTDITAASQRLAQVAGNTQSQGQQPSLDPQSKFAQFFEQNFDAAAVQAAFYDVDVTHLLGLAAYESGWGTNNHTRNFNNPFGVTPDGLNPMRFGSISDAWEYWGRIFGPRVANTGPNASRFIDNLLLDNRNVFGPTIGGDRRGAYNSVNPDWATGVAATIRSVQQRLPQWQGYRP